MMPYKIRIEPFGSLVHSTDKAITIELTKQETRDLLGYKGTFPEHPKGIMSPRIVHLELTSSCDMDPLCNYCYAHPSKYSVVEEEDDCLSTSDWKGVIAKLRDAGTFQVTFGGGEPTCREDLSELAYYVKGVGKMNLAMTTNGWSIIKGGGNNWLGVFDQINISCHGSMSKVLKAILTIKGLTKLGINFLCSKDAVMYDYPRLLNFYEYFKSSSLVETLLLSYKPQKIKDYEYIVPRSKILEMAKELHSLGAPTAIDGLTCGICEGGYSFCDISSTGEVYPCSFVRKSYGNILKEPLKDIWNRMPRVIECPYERLYN